MVATLLHLVNQVHHLADELDSDCIQCNADGLYRFEMGNVVAHPYGAHHVFLCPFHIENLVHAHYNLDAGTFCGICTERVAADGSDGSFHCQQENCMESAFCQDCSGGQVFTHCGDTGACCTACHRRFLDRIEGEEKVSQFFKKNQPPIVHALLSHNVSDLFLG